MFLSIIHPVVVRIFIILECRFELKISYFFIINVWISLWLDLLRIKKT